MSYDEFLSSVSKFINTSVISNKGESQNAWFKKTKDANFPKKNNISYPLKRTRSYVCVSGCKKCLFFGKFGVLCFLESPVLRFALLPSQKKIDFHIGPTVSKNLHVLGIMALKFDHAFQNNK